MGLGASYRGGGDPGQEQADSADGKCRVPAHLSPRAGQRTLGELATHPCDQFGVHARPSLVPLYGYHLESRAPSETPWRHCSWVQAEGEARLRDDGLLRRSRAGQLRRHPLDDVPDGWVNVHGHEHHTPPRRSPHINVSVEQFNYRPILLDRLRRLAQHVVVGDSPPGTTTLERSRWLEMEHGANRPLADSGAAGLDD